jgi:hypothetical protein
MTRVTIKPLRRQKHMPLKPKVEKVRLKRQRQLSKMEDRSSMKRAVIVGLVTSHQAQVTSRVLKTRSPISIKTILRLTPALTHVMNSLQ